MMEDPKEDQGFKPNMVGEPESAISHEPKIKTEIKLEDSLCSNKFPQVADPKTALFNVQAELVHVLASNP